MSHLTQYLPCVWIYGYDYMYNDGTYFWGNRYREVWTVVVRDGWVVVDVCTSLICRQLASVEEQGVGVTLL